MLAMAGNEAKLLAHNELTNLVYSGLLLLDAKDFAGWLDSCDAGFTYAIRVWSPEIRKEMTWLAHDRAGLAALIQQLPRHNTDRSIFTRHATVYTIELDDDLSAANIVSTVTVYRTELDGGATSLFAVGRYRDRAVRAADGWRLRGRELRLDTRSLGIGTHYPL
jgi:methanesulfonate monooxygenase small subunit